MNSLKELYAYREMIFSLVRKDLRTRYKGSVLGFLWTFINPLLQLIVNSVVFSVIMRVQMDKYYIYMFVGLLPWIFFCNCLQAGTTSVVSGQDLIKKIYFPRLVLPIATVSAAFMNMLFSMGVMFGALFVSGKGITAQIIYLPLLLLLLYFLGLGLTFVFSACNVYLRDLEHILGIITMSMFYVTPILYPISMVPDRLLKVLYINPMTPMVLAFQDVLYYQRAPHLDTLVIVIAYVVIALVAGYFIFQRLQRNFVEEL